MNILSHTEEAIKKYLNDFKEGRIKKPESCENCGNKSNLTWHAKYTRRLITLAGIYHLPIRRLCCPVCNHTFALLPKFIKKFCRYGKDIIQYVVRQLKKHTYDHVAEELMIKSSIDIAINTLSSWNRKFANQIV